MQTPTMKTHGHLAAFGALGVCVGAVGIFALFYWITAQSPTGGLDAEHSLISRLAIGVIVAALIGVHYAFARQLLTYVKEQKGK
ncbi:MAG: hypothetical protein IT361_14560 [Gemmatimonadaceae bacterium]|nr:hypothetical protein [Gemmatimonadaceae bacterium]